MGSGDVADVVEVEAEDPAQPGFPDRSLSLAETLPDEPGVVDPGLQSLAMVPQLAVAWGRLYFMVVLL